MPRNEFDEENPLESIGRREFCRKTIKRTLLATGVVAAPLAAYKRPEVRSFFGAKNAYAATTGPTLAAPTGLTATVISSTQIDLSWTDNSTGETGFKIERKTGSGGTWSQIATVGSNITSYNNTGLSGGTTYYYRVRAYNASTNSSYSNEANGSTSSTLAAPTGLTATVISSTQIDLSWTDNSTGETGFKIERKTGSGGTWSQIATVGSNITSYSDTTVAEGTSYTYRVRAYNSSGSSGYSNEPAGVDPTIANQFGNATFGQATFQ